MDFETLSYVFATQHKLHMMRVLVAGASFFEKKTILNLFVCLNSCSLGGIFHLFRLFYTKDVKNKNDLVIVRLGFAGSASSELKLMY